PPRRSSDLMPAQRGLLAQSWRIPSAVGSVALMEVSVWGRRGVAAGSGQALVGGQGQELDQLVVAGERLEQGDGLARARRAGDGALRRQPRRQVEQRLLEQAEVDDGAVVQAHRLAAA